MLPDFRPTSPSFFDELFTILPGICFNKEEMSGIFYERLNGSSVFFFLTVSKIALATPDRPQIKKKRNAFWSMINV